jgi:DNA-binding beta-propeller fold protein YncE
VNALRDPHQHAGFICLLAVMLAGCAGATATAPAAPPSAASTILPTLAAPATPMPDPTPRTTEFDGLTATEIPLGHGAAPIDVAFAFGSIWVANHHAFTVSRIDPDSLTEVARLQVGAGPGWFAITDDAVWVSSQMGHGLSRVDPATNSVQLGAGSWATCGAPVVLDGSIWQMACDAGQLMRIDPATNKSTDIGADGFSGVGLVGSTLIANGPDSLTQFDPASMTFKPIKGCCGFPVGFDDRSVWLAEDEVLHRIAVADGSVIADLPIGGEVAVTFAGPRAWVTQFGGEVFEVDLATSKVVRTLTVPRPAVARELDRALWVTSFDASVLWRIRL